MDNDIDNDTDSDIESDIASNIGSDIGSEPIENGESQVGDQPHEFGDHASVPSDPSPSSPDVNAGGEQSERVEPEAANEVTLEMRQVAGLTAGSSMLLPPGKVFQFNETTTSGPAAADGQGDSASFVLRVSDEGRVIVVPGSATAIVNETVVEEPTFVGNGILSVGSACFTVRPTRGEANAATLERTETALKAPRAIEVGDLETDGDIEALFGSIRDTRHAVAERHRLVHPDPEELKNRLARVDPGLWERGRDHRFFSRYSVGYAIIPWQPKFDSPERIPDHLHDAINRMSVLPWVPITTNLLQGPIAIHGGRASTLAICRHALLSLAALTAPGDIRFSVVTGRDQVDDWQWTKSLPELMSPTGSEDANGDGPNHYQLSVVDGAHHLETAGLSIGNAGPKNGIIVLAPDRESIPDGCATYIAAEDGGTAVVTNHLGEEISATPIGVTEAFAHDMATRIADILIGYR